MVSIPSVQRVLPCLWLLALQLPTYVFGWGEYGHEIIANLAWNRLTPAVQDEITAILNITNVTLIKESGSPLAAVANWADHVRHFLPWTAPLHYIDIRDDLVKGGCHYHLSKDDEPSDEDCIFQYDRDCPEDQCVVGAIMNYSSQLVDAVAYYRHEGSFPDRQKYESSHSFLRSQRKKNLLTGSSSDRRMRQALMFLVHFIGDIFQPLHVSRISDKGGNDIHVLYHLLKDPAQAPKRPSRHERGDMLQIQHHHAWNLHSIWDTALIETALERHFDNQRAHMEEALEFLILKHPEWVKQYASCSIGKVQDVTNDGPATGIQSLNADMDRNWTCVGLWGQESWGRALKYSYTKNEPWDDRASNATVEEVANGDEIDEDYYQTRISIVTERLIAGGIRLAVTLENIFGSVDSNDNKKLGRKNHVEDNGTKILSSKSIRSTSFVQWVESVHIGLAMSSNLLH